MEKEDKKKNSSEKLSPAEELFLQLLGTALIFIIVGVILLAIITS